MISKARILCLSFATAMLLLFVLCLGSQNLQDRKSLNLGFSKTAPLPTGFLLGISLILGVVSGGSARAIFLPKESLNKKN